MMKRRTWILAVSLMAGITFIFAGLAQADASNDNKQVKVLTKALEVVSVTQKAEQCRDQKGVTVRLKVVGDKAVDVRRYLSLGGNWLPKEFRNQDVGGEIVDYSCNENSSFKFYTREAGSSQEFPRP